MTLKEGIEKTYFWILDQIDLKKIEDQKLKEEIESYSTQNEDEEDEQDQ